MLPEGEPVPEKEEEGQMEVDGQNENQESERGNEESHEKMEETEEGKTEKLDRNRGRKRKRENEEDKEGERVEHVNQESEVADETEEVTGEEQRENAGSEIVKSVLCFFLFNFVLLTRAKMLGSGELVPENEEEEEGLDGQDVNQDSEVADETEEETGEEQRENAGSEKDEENPSGLVVEDDEEERRRRAAEKGKQHYEFEDDHLDLAILKAMCSTRNPSYNQRLLQFVKDSFPDLKISIKDLERKVIRLENSFNDIRELHGDDPEMVRPIDREIFDLSMIIWGQR